MTRPKNDTFLRALLREPVDYTPIWLMRQAGRYLPEYCETRKRAGSFLNLCKNPQPGLRGDAATAGALPARRGDPLFRHPDRAGRHGPRPLFRRRRGARSSSGPLREEWAIRDLTAPDPNVHLRYVMDAVAEIRRALDNSVPLIGFSGSPFTLACYMVEGGGSDDFRTVKTMLYDRPDLLHHILDVTSQRGDRLPERPDRIRRPGGDDLRHLGRRAARAAYQRILAGLHAAHRRRPEEGP